MSTSKRNQFVSNVNFSNPIAACLNIAQVTNMPYFITWASMILLVRVKVGSSTCTAYKLNTNVNSRSGITIIKHSKIKAYHLYCLQIRGCGNRASLVISQSLLLLLLLENQDSTQEWKILNLKKMPSSHLTAKKVNCILQFLTAYWAHDYLKHVFKIKVLFAGMGFPLFSETNASI